MKTLETSTPDSLGAATGSPSLGEDDEITCWDCKGTGSVRCFHGMLGCPRCGGLGRVPKITEEWFRTGRRVKRNRLDRRVSMRDEAIRLGVNLIAYSDIELGKIDPAVIAHLLPENA